MNHCPITQDLNLHLNQLDTDLIRETAIDDRAADLMKSIAGVDDLLESIYDSEYTARGLTIALWSFLEHGDTAELRRVLESAAQRKAQAELKGIL